MISFIVLVRTAVSLEQKRAVVHTRRLLLGIFGDFTVWRHDGRKVGRASRGGNFSFPKWSFNRPLSTDGNANVLAAIVLAHLRGENSTWCFWCELMRLSFVLVTVSCFLRTVLQNSFRIQSNAFPIINKTICNSSPIALHDLMTTRLHHDVTYLRRQLESSLKSVAMSMLICYHTIR